MDNKGYNFLHTAIQKSDIESVLFLMSVQANVNSPTQDSKKLMPLHLAVMAGSEMIVRNLVSQENFTKILEAFLVFFTNIADFYQ